MSLKPPVGPNTPLGTGRVFYNVVADGGAHGNGVTDDATSIQTTLNAASGTVYFPSGTYRSISGLSVPSALTLMLDDATLDFSDLASSGTAFTAAGSLGTGVAVNAVAFGATAITGSAGIESGFTAGDVIKLYSADEFAPDRDESLHGELCTVLSTASGTINVRSPVMGTYSTTVKVAKVTMSSLRLTGSGRIQMGGTGSSHFGLTAKWLKNLRIDGQIEFVDCEARTIELWDCLDFDIGGCDIQGASSASNGYGVSIVNASQFGRVHHCHFRNCRHGTTVSFNPGDPGVVRHVSFENNVVRDTITNGDAMDTHSNGEYITFAENDIYDSGFVGINIECNKATVKNNRIYRPAHNGIYMLATAAGAPEWRVIGNEVYDSPQHGIRYNALAGGNVSTPLVLDIMDNELVRCAESAVWCDPSTGAHRLLGARVSRNRAYACGSTGTRVFYINDADASEICDNISVQTPAAIAGTYVEDFTKGKWNGNVADYAVAATTKAHQGFSVVDSEIAGNVVKNGTGTGGGGIILDGSNSTGNRVHDNHLLDSTTAFTTMTGTANLLHDNRPGKVVDVASAASITLGGGENDTYRITGTTNVNTITTTNMEGRTVTLIVNTGFTFGDGAGNLVLNGDFVANGNDVLVLRCFVNSWYEMSRSAN